MDMSSGDIHNPVADITALPIDEDGDRIPPSFDGSKAASQLAEDLFSDSADDNVPGDESRLQRKVANDTLNPNEGTISKEILEQTLIPENCWDAASDLVKDLLSDMDKDEQSDDLHLAITSKSNQENPGSNEATGSRSVSLFFASEDEGSFHGVAATPTADQSSSSPANRDTCEHQVQNLLKNWNSACSTDEEMSAACTGSMHRSDSEVETEETMEFEKNEKSANQPTIGIDESTKTFQMENNERAKINSGFDEEDPLPTTNNQENEVPKFVGGTPAIGVKFNLADESKRSFQRDEESDVPTSSNDQTTSSASKQKVTNKKRSHSTAKLDSNEMQQAKKLKMSPPIELSSTTNNKQDQERSHGPTKSLKSKGKKRNKNHGGKDTKIKVADCEPKQSRYFVKRFKLSRCKVCNVAFAKEESLQKHTETEHPASKFVGCDQCDAFFSGCELLEKHKVTCHHEKSTPYNCEEFDEGFGNHIDTNVKQPKFARCRVCQIIFTEEVSLQRHLEAEHPAPKIVGCDDCDAIFSTDALLEQHKYFCHTKSTPYNCELCDEGFDYLTDFKKHNLRYHLDDDTIPNCTECGLCFNTPELLKKHMHVHKSC